MDANSVSQLLQEGIVRTIGLLWVCGAVFMVVQVRREAMIDGMISQISRMSGAIADDDDSPRRDDEDARRKALEDAWEDRDDRSRRRWLGVQAILLAATGLAMAAFHVWASWLIAVLIGAQGVYFIVRERAARSAPTPELAKAARPSQSTVNAGWFSLAAGVIVWSAHIGGHLIDSRPAQPSLAPGQSHNPNATPAWLASFQTRPERHQA